MFGKMRSRICRVAALAVGCVVACGAGADEGRTIVCEGEYVGHLQGVATDGASIFWSFTKEVVRTDLTGKILATTGAVPSHHGDLCVKDGIVYVAVNLGRFNQLAAGRSEVRAYEALTLKPCGQWPLPEMGSGAGGMTCANGCFFVIGGLPTTVEENSVYEYDADFRFRRRHVLATGFTLMGIQTAAFEDGRFLFGIYGEAGNPRGVLDCPADLSSFTRRLGEGAEGILKLGGVYWTARTPKGAKGGYRGVLVRSDGYPANCPVYEATPTGKGALKVFYEGRDATGWTDCGYQLAPNGYKTMANAKTYVRRADVTSATVFPAAGIGGARSYSVPDILRAVRRAAVRDEVLSLHVPGTPETVASDARLADALRAVVAEARRLGLEVK